jgi:hypothetical protein
VNGFFQFIYSFQPHLALGFTQPLTEISTISRKIMFLGSKARPERQDDKVTVTREPNV